jgi:hypothetical protein
MWGLSLKVVSVKNKISSHGEREAVEPSSIKVAHKKGRLRGPVQILSVNSVVVSLGPFQSLITPLVVFLSPCILRQSLLAFPESS